LVKGFRRVRLFVSDLYFMLILALDKDNVLTVAEIIIIHDLTNHYQ